MEIDLAVRRLSALAQPGRLAAFRLLVQAGPDGLPAGEIARGLEVAPNTLSAQLAVLTNAGEAMPIVVAVLVGSAQPIRPVHILWVNLVTASTLGRALAFEPTEENTMRRPPRRRGAGRTAGPPGR